MTYLLRLCLFKCISVQIFVMLIMGPNYATSGCDYELFGQDHTMCKYNTPACTILRSGLNEEERQEVIRAHNKARQKVANGHQQGQPGSSNMRQVGWSNELAMIAQRWAEQCRYDHDHNRRTRIFKHVSQNIFQSYSNKQKNSNADVKEAVQTWFNEVESPGFKADDINPFRFRESVGHYTGLVWADTDLIGCGFVHYQQSDRLYYKLTVCNYAPGGNIKDDVMYKMGAPCSSCLNGCSKSYPGLCDFHLNGAYMDQLQVPLTYNADPKPQKAKDPNTIVGEENDGDDAMKKGKNKASLVRHNKQQKISETNSDGSQMYYVF